MVTEGYQKKIQDNPIVVIIKSLVSLEIPLAVNTIIKIVDNLPLLS